MAPLAGHLVGYLSMFLQLGVLALLAVLAVLVRTSLGRRRFDGWTAGLCANAAALAILAVAAVGRDADLLPALPGATIAYAVLEDLAALAFVYAIRCERGLRPLTAPLVGLFAVAVCLTTIAAFASPAFFSVYRVHSASFGVLLALGALAGVRVRARRIGTQLLTVSLAALALDYLHVPLLSLLGVQFPMTYLGLESYITMVLDIALGVAIVVHATDGARAELEQRNAALAHAERALREAAYTDALCGIPNRGAFLERIEAPPASGTVAMIDLDNLKTINDRFGHGAGDAALATAARCLRERCGDAGRIYRIGGDEFAGIWDGVGTDAVRAVLAVIDADLAVLGEDLQTPVRISWGVAAFNAEHAFAEALIAADTRLYDSRTIRSRLTIELRRG
ncbi:MAG: GGDEF domain-containing protein [Candidatus Eremiobacteraeota bacterium]|nr:GGDEF domain-containing protein [Candidatus Eremiobacteraeota bacterium]